MLRVPIIMNLFWIMVMIIPQNFETVISGTVISDHYFEILIGLCQNAIQSLRQIASIVVIWDENSNLWRRIHNQKPIYSILRSRSNVG